MIKLTVQLTDTCRGIAQELEKILSQCGQVRFEGVGPFDEEELFSLRTQFFTNDKEPFAGE